MAPGRKRGANNKTKTSTNFSLGDLVLAKVKGFPAWPAKVSRPEDWERAPDPKKIFVQFFGTQEIAFIAPADVYAFTSESKSRLLLKCRGRTIKYFPQAVKEICDVFERLQQSELDGSSKQIGSSSYASVVEQGKVKRSHAEVKKEHGCEGSTRSNIIDESGSLLGDCPSTDDMSHAHEEQGTTVEESGGIPDCQTFKKSIRDGTRKESGVPVSSPVVSSSIKEEINSTENKLDRAHSSIASNWSPYGCRSDVELDTSGVKAGKKNNSISLGVSGRVKVPAPGDKKTANGQKSKDVNVGSKRKHEGAVRHTDDSKSSGRMTDKISGKVVSSENGKLLSPGSNNSELNSARKITKTHMKGQKHWDTNKNSPENIIAYSKDRGDGDLSKKNTLTVSQEQSHSAKNAKHMDTIVDAVKVSVVKNKKNVESVSADDEAVLPLAKRHRRAVEGLSDVNVPLENKKMHCPSNYKNEVSKKRRAVRLYDDEEEVPKTPVHGGPLSSKVSSAAIPESTKSTDGSRDVSNSNRESLKCHIEDMSMEDCPLPTALVSESSIAGTSLDKKDSPMKAEASHSPKIEDLDNQPLRNPNMDLISPSKSPLVVSVNKLRDQQKSNMPLAKGSTTGSHIKARKGSLKGPSLVSDASIPSQSQISAHKSRQPLSGEKLKGTKLTLRNEPAALDIQRDQGSMQGGSNRLEDATDKSASLVDLKAGESSSLSIKHLIAAAQARRREALVPNVPLGNGNAAVAPANILRVRSPSPSLGDQAFPKSGVDNVIQPDAVGAISRGSVASPSGYNRISLSQPDSEEPEEKRLSSTRQVSGGTLSGGTEAAVARDAFEGMIETLSRTKDSIGRATRLAIDCAKYGIANEVVDLLIRKLENETSFHRRVDLFFLVDSITQCSHSQKGIAGASYIPTVQVALPRLLGAAAPSGASARENRRQCLKVLRLWRQRKIFPEYLLKRHMDGIGGTSDDIGSGLSHKRPSRAERSVDDPIREMEGMLVDEYGSNATFNLPGFLHSRGFVDDEDEDDVPTTTCKESDVSPPVLLSSSIEAERGTVSPIDRQHHILEDVEGEFEMEDVSGHLKNGALSPGSSPKNEKQETYLNTGLESPIDIIFEPLSPEGSPPMPLEPAPALPPLPLSPYPPPPPASWPSPPPPPPTSLTSLPPPPPPPPPPPVLMSQPPQPPSFASQPLQHPSLLPPLLPSGPPQPGHFQPMLPQQPSTTHQVLPQPPSLHAPMQAPLPPDYNIPSGVQPIQMSGNSSQQVPCFTPAGSSGSRDLSGYSSRPFEYGQSDMFPGPQGGHPNKQFQLNQQFQPAFAQRLFSPIPVPQPISNNFTYNKLAVQQHMPNSHPLPPAPPPPLPSHLYSSASQVQWMSASAEFKLENQHSSSWLNGGRTPVFPTSVGEAYFRPHERQPPNNVGYQVSAPNPALAGPSTQGHGSLNCWRPV